MILLAPASRLAAGDSPDFPAIFNTQNPKDVPLPPAEAVKLMKPPPGFRAELFAGEPDVQQPIGFSMDDRGRLWVCENYTYGEAQVGFDLRLRDRIVILEDSRHSGHFDKRTVFWDKGQRLTSAVAGFGGVWVLAAPQLLFIPDKNGDDQPDGEPVVVLDGWNDNTVRHNIVNGLFWGPDGWLYGRHGITTSSYIGKPGTPASERVAMNCGVWRYHPTRKIFEVVANGTTNPWGLDYNEDGEMFFINTVIGHLWHCIPGAHYKRMFGEDFNPHLYGLIDQHADHYHWDTGKSWTDSRNAAGASDSLGGGHAHAGLMFYLGDNWPAQYHNTLLTINLHGRRLNNDLVERSGSGYVGKHAPDIFKTDDAWFRAIDLISGPDGGVFVADWSDVGECHESDGVHRTSGRIYKLTHGDPAAPAITNVAALSTLELCRLQTHPNDWFTRHARRLLQERAAAGEDMDGASAELNRLFESAPSAAQKLKALWSLYVIGAAPEAWLLRQLHHENEHIRAWAIRLLIDQGAPGAAAASEFVAMARSDASGLVRLYLSSALQRLPVDQRFALAAGLASHAEDANDHNLPLMIWYGIEPSVPGDAPASVELARSARIPLLQRYIARRLAEELEANPQGLSLLLNAAVAADGPEFAIETARGMAEATRGWRKATKPDGWDAIAAKLEASGNPEARQKTRDLALLFGDGRAELEMRGIAANTQLDAGARQKALLALIDSRPADLASLLRKLATDKAVALVAGRGLLALNDPHAPELLVGRFDQFSPREKASVVEALATRPEGARRLLAAVAAGTVPRGDISAFNARQINNLGDAEIAARLREVWGEVRDTAKKEVIARYRAALSPTRLGAANAGKGRALFNQVCAICHTLYGEGARIGPDLTGSGRADLGYLLDNIVDPSAIVPVDYQVSIVDLKDGRSLNGILRDPTARTITIQSPGAALTVERAEIAKVTTSSTSLMPEGLLESLKDEQVADLVRYLMSPNQVPVAGNN
jgi:putative membrane-bound dehydrogenase-like protein